jgi:hypothetical protein
MASFGSRLCRKHGPKDEEIAADGASEGVPQPLVLGVIGIMRRHCYQGAPFGAPSPLKVEGRKLKAQLARRRGNASAWLFEI